MADRRASTAAPGVQAGRRRRRGVRLLTITIALVGAALSPGSGNAAPTPRSPSGSPADAVFTPFATGPAASRASWVVRENLRPGTSDWQIPLGMSAAIEGYANKVSVQQGDALTLFVSTPAARFQVRAYRMGWYQGDWGRLIWTSAWVRGGRQAAPVRTPATNMVEAGWHPSIHLFVSRRWPEGVYLLKLVSSAGAAQFVPLTVRNDASHAALVIQNEVTTWQAYNDWGGYSLYGGPTGRATIVSFDRPYAGFRGGAGILNGTELPLIVLAEKAGYDVTYWTDVDFHERPQLLLNHRALISLGHDEYWSSSMRDMALDARAD
ncbi:MAG TPA: N,N-dimethylformamidase beta subunit family domain-containing protein, partial [Actinomycetota bacterium]|nr:N,N-dimethylformamidase beta subunit family domain-containing protein [Actinomycetota bacterium]